MREPPTAPGPRRARRAVLHTSRRTVLELAALFSVDSAGSGFVVTSLLVLWLHLRFDLTAAATGAVFFAAGLLGACSQALAPRLARRFGLIRTMAFTHIPANCLLILAAFAPTGAIAIALLLARALFAQMDVPARQAFVMAVVPADERAAASSVTNVPRSLASATTPLLAGVAARPHDLRLAADHRRRHQDRLRPHPARPLPRRPRGGRCPPDPAGRGGLGTGSGSARQP